ncbi:MAG: Crp/Fnr family transcriptional regulator [Cyclobacteriaceae bacterium]
MTNTLDSFIKQFTFSESLSAQTNSGLASICNRRKIKKGAAIIEAGELCGDEIYVVSGVLRAYINADLKEYTSTFYKDGQFVTPWFARQMNGESLISLQTLENSDLMLFDEKKFTNLRRSNEDLLALGNKVVEKELLLKSKKELILATGKLRELYCFFQEVFPGLENRIAQRYVATYLGVDPVSLSRIRKEIQEETKKS